MKGGACAAIVESNRIELNVRKRKRRRTRRRKDEARRRREWSPVGEKLCEAWDRKISKTQLAGSEDPFEGDAVRRLAHFAPSFFFLLSPLLLSCRRDKIAWWIPRFRARLRIYPGHRSFTAATATPPTLTRQFQRLLNDSSPARGIVQLRLLSFAAALPFGYFLEDAFDWSRANHRRASCFTADLPRDFSSPEWNTPERLLL